MVIAPSSSINILRKSKRHTVVKVTIHWLSEHEAPERQIWTRKLNKIQRHLCNIWPELYTSNLATGILSVCNSIFDMRAKANAAF